MATISWLLGTFGEYQVMTQPVPRELSITPLIIRDFRGCPLLLAGSNLASATLNHQNWTKAHILYTDNSKATGWSTDLAKTLWVLRTFGDASSA
jgi:hypothetical protein